MMKTLIKVNLCYKNKEKTKSANVSFHETQQFVLTNFFLKKQNVLIDHF